MIIKVFEGKLPKQLSEEIKQFDVEGVSSYLDDAFTFTTGVVESENEIVAAGIIRVVNELKIILKPEISNINKAMALKLLLNESRKHMQCNEAIALITQGGNHYTNILKTHFGFYEDPGIFLRLERGT